MKQNPRVAYFDALRGIAIIMVMMVHASSYLQHGLTGIMYRLVGEGARGVQLFYILSALTLFMTLGAGSYVGERTQTIKYFVRRFFRIAPLFYVVILVTATAAYFFPHGILSYIYLTPMSVITSLTFTNSFDPRYINDIILGQWSIAIETMFYLMIPVLFMRIRDAGTAFRYYFASLAFASLLELFLPIMFPTVTKDVWELYLFFSLPIQLPVFFLGIIGYFMIYEAYPGFEAYNQKVSIFFLAFWTIVTEAIFLTAKHAMFGYWDVSIVTPRVFIEAVGFLGIVFLFSNGYLMFLQGKAFQYVGKVSYSVYLLHELIFRALTQNALYPVLVAHLDQYTEYAALCAVAGIISVLAASVTYRLVEVPGQAWGKRLIAKYF